MGEQGMRIVSRAKTFAAAFRYSIPVLLGFLTVGIAYGLVLLDAGLPWWLAPISCVVVFAGAGQFLAVIMLAAGAGLAELFIAEIILNLRHIAYGVSLHRRIGETGRFKWYLIYALVDETFALVSSLPEELEPELDRTLLMVYIAALNQTYWICGALIGVAAGALIPFDFEGVDFALTSLFLVLMVEQIRRVKKPGPFIIAALVSILAVIVLPPRFALSASLAVSIVLVQYAMPRKDGREP
jgi:4-azaleucine resistance transporter AzlC